MWSPPCRNAEREGIDWLIHIDDDELILPGALASSSLTDAQIEVFRKSAPRISEALLPRVDCQDAFKEASEFRSM